MQSLAGAGVANFSGGPVAAGLEPAESAASPQAQDLRLQGASVSRKICHARWCPAPRNCPPYPSGLAQARIERPTPMQPLVFLPGVILALALAPSGGHAQIPPTDWIDPATGHRVL